MEQTERIWEKCPTCGNSKMIADSKIICDVCKKVLQEPYVGYDQNNYDGWLNMTIFFEEDHAKDFDFCSWKCCFEKLKNLENNEFVTLPHLSNDHMREGCKNQDFLDLIK